MHDDTSPFWLWGCELPAAVSKQLEVFSCALLNCWHKLWTLLPLRVRAVDLPIKLSIALLLQTSAVPPGSNLVTCPSAMRTGLSRQTVQPIELNLALLMQARGHGTRGSSPFADSSHCPSLYHISRLSFTGRWMRLHMQWQHLPCAFAGSSQERSSQSDDNASES